MHPLFLYLFRDSKSHKVYSPAQHNKLFVTRNLKYKNLFHYLVETAIYQEDDLEALNTTQMNTGAMTQAYSISRRVTMKPSGRFLRVSMQKQKRTLTQMSLYSASSWHQALV